MYKYVVKEELKYVLLFLLTNILCTFWSSNQKVQVKLLIGTFIERKDYMTTYHPIIILIWIPWSKSTFLLSFLLLLPSQKLNIQNVNVEKLKDLRITKKDRSKHIIFSNL